jgi:hypothetical protein
LVEDAMAVAFQGRRVLVVAGWQAVNIGDVAHVPSLLALMERELPGVSATVWPYRALPEEVVGVIRGRFPGVTLLESTPDPGAIEDGAVLAAMDEADLLLHGSGPATLGWRHCEAFARRTGRGFGVYGVTYGMYGVPERDTLSRARFVLLRDSLSLEAARGDGVAPRQIGLALDSAFAMDLRDDGWAGAYLGSVGLEAGKFVCAIARWRNTPFWEMPGHNTAVDPVRLAANEASAEVLTAPILKAVVRVVRETGMQVLLCPEDTTHIRVNREWVYDRLPEDVKGRVVWRDRFWTPGQAASVYARSAGLFGAEMHSPIMCIGMGVPAVVGRWKEQSTKGYMWRDIGLGEWLFNFDEAGERETFVAAAVEMAGNVEGSRAKAEAARQRVLESQKRTMAIVGAELERA